MTARRMGGGEVSSRRTFRIVALQQRKCTRRAKVLREAFFRLGNSRLALFPE